MIKCLGTYLPTWLGDSGGRVRGTDEDAITMAVAAGRGALAKSDELAQLTTVNLITRDFALLEGGNAAALLAGLGLDPSTDVIERLGGAPATFDAIGSAAPGSLVIAVDTDEPAGAGAVLVASSGSEFEVVARAHRSLPLKVRHPDGKIFEDSDSRLQRERGLRASLTAAGLSDIPHVLAGASPTEAALLGTRSLGSLPTRGTSASIFALAAMAESNSNGVVVATEQATVTAARWNPQLVDLNRDEPASQLPRAQRANGSGIRFAFTAYDRAFESKVRWKAAQCAKCATLSFPPRRRCLECGSESPTQLVALPRAGRVYTTTTVHTPVPGLPSPYTLTIVELDSVDVRVLVGVTDVVPGAIEIGMHGRLVFRRVATRAGVPDYGYSFSPDVAA